MKKTTTAILASGMVFAIIFSGCTLVIRPRDPHFYIDMPETKIQLLDTNEIYSELLSILKPDNDTLFINSWSLHCQMAPDGELWLLFTQVYALKGDFVYGYHVSYISCANQPEQGAQISFSAYKPEKYRDSIFATETPMLDLREVLEGINHLPWDSIFNEYRVGNPAQYSLHVGVFDFGISDNYFPQNSERYFLLSNNGHEEIDTLSQLPSQNYNFIVSPAYASEYLHSYRPDNRLLFLYDRK